MSAKTICQIHEVYGLVISSHIRLPKFDSSYLSGIKFYSDSKRLLKSRIQMSRRFPTLYAKERSRPGFRKLCSLS